MLLYLDCSLFVFLIPCMDVFCLLLKSKRFLTFLFLRLLSSLISAFYDWLVKLVKGALECPIIFP